MEPIDQSFRPRRDFYVVWCLLVAPTVWLTHDLERDFGWFSYTAFVMLLSLFSTFALYGPVLLARQVFRSGTRGWFVFRVLVSTIAGATLFCAILYFTGHADSHSAMCTGLLSFSTTAYFHWRLRERPRG